MMTENKEIAFVHFDTSFLAYGINGQNTNPKMGEYFKKQGWNNEQVFGMIESHL